MNEAQEARKAMLDSIKEDAVHERASDGKALVTARTQTISDKHTEKQDITAPMLSLFAVGILALVIVRVVLARHKRHKDD